MFKKKYLAILFLCGILLSNYKDFTNAFIDVSKKSNPAIVSIISQKEVEAYNPFKSHPFFQDDFFPKDFLIGSNLSVSDLTNASFFLNTLAKKKITNLKKSNSLASKKDSKLSELQKESFKHKTWILPLKDDIKGF